jgi:hypothetical protein
MMFSVVAFVLMGGTSNGDFVGLESVTRKESPPVRRIITSSERRHDTKALQRRQHGAPFIGQLVL